VRHLSLILVTLAALAILPGCDLLYGIRRTAPVNEAPSFACIEAAIRSVEGIDQVRHEVREGGRPLTFTGIQKPDEVHYFFYGSGEVGATLMISIDYAGDVTFDQSLCRVNHPVPQEQIDAVRPLMIRIEHAIQEQCGLPRLSESVEEWVH